jgi:hypothetical protein
MTENEKWELVKHAEEQERVLRELEAQEEQEQEVQALELGDAATRGLGTRSGAAAPASAGRICHGDWCGNPKCPASSGLRRAGELGSD